MLAYCAANPDFTIYSISDGASFQVEKHFLVSGSQVFRTCNPLLIRKVLLRRCPDDMFLSCLPDSEQSLTINEPSAMLAVLLRFLHEPPPLLPIAPKTSSIVGARGLRSSGIPFPLLSTLLYLGDKYGFSEPLLAIIRSHLGAYISTFPLQVYGHAMRMNWGALAADASEFLLGPLTSYSAEEIAVIPNADAYHRLVVLQETRVKALRQFLLGEELFPHGYGYCSRHGTQMAGQWDAMKNQLAQKVEASKLESSY
jgi:hypothetical protein